MNDAEIRIECLRLAQAAEATYPFVSAQTGIGYASSAPQSRAADAVVARANAYYNFAANRLSADEPKPTPVKAGDKLIVVNA